MELCTHFLWIGITVFVMDWKFVVVQLLSHVLLFVTPWTAAHQDSLSFTISQSLLKLMSIVLMMPSNLSHPLSIPFPPALNLPGIRVFSTESTLHITYPEQTIRLKIYWAWLCPAEQDPVLPTAIPSHQEARTTIPQPPEWKPQSQKTNQNDHMNHSLVVVKVCGPLEKRRANHLSILASRSPWTVWNFVSPPNSYVEVLTI